MPSPRDPQVWGPAAIALAALITPVRWVTGLALTAVHEGGHAVMAMATGRRLKSVTLDEEGGVTDSRGPDFGIGRTLTAAAGYPAPSLFGLGCAYALHQKYQPVSLLIAAMILLGLLFLVIRNPYGAVVVGGLAVAAYFLVYRASAHLQVQAVRTVTWTLLLGGMDGVIELRQLRWRGLGPTDADNLPRFSLIPGLVWEALFWAVAFVSLIYGRRMDVHLRSRRRAEDLQVRRSMGVNGRDSARGNRGPSQLAKTCQHHRCDAGHWRLTHAHPRSH